jgi:hypothetical protein
MSMVYHVTIAAIDGVELLRAEALTTVIENIDPNHAGGYKLVRVETSHQ